MHGKRRRQSARMLWEWHDLFGASRDWGLVDHMVAADTQGQDGAETTPAIAPSRLAGARARVARRLRAGSRGSRSHGRAGGAIGIERGRNARRNAVRPQA